MPLKHLRGSSGRTPDKLHVSIALHVIRKRGMDAAKCVYMRVRLVRTRLVKCTGMCISLRYIGFEAAHALRVL